MPRISMQVREDVNGFYDDATECGPRVPFFFAFVAGGVRDKEGLVLKTHRFALLRAEFAIETRGEVSTKTEFRRRDFAGAEELISASVHGQFCGEARIDRRFKGVSRKT